MDNFLNWTTLSPGVEDWPGGDGVHEARGQDVPGGRRRHWQERSPHLGEKDQRLACHAANLDISFLSFWNFSSMSRFYKLFQNSSINLKYNSHPPSQYMAIF